VTETTQTQVGVLIATPGRDMHAQYVQSLVRTLAALDKLNITYAFLNRYSSLVASAREQTVLDSHSNEYGTSHQVAGGRYSYRKIFWIDSDISWEPEDFIRLYEQDLDIIGGVYRTSELGTVAVNVNSDLGLPQFVHETSFLLQENPMKVDGIGFGFLAVKAGVFEKMPRPWFKTRTIQWPDVPYETDMGEDYSWCVSAAQTGYDLWVDPLVRVRHHKETVYRVQL
jgi:hypothetical protein